jgi:hypothetical protein
MVYPSLVAALVPQKNHVSIFSLKEDGLADMKEDGQALEKVFDGETPRP